MRLLIDGDVLLHKAIPAARTEVQWSPGCYSLALDVNVAASIAADILQRWIDGLNADSAILTFSDPVRRYFRHEIYPDYKAGRSPCLPGWMDLVARVSAMEKSVCWQHLEADDVLGILATEEGDTDDVIVSIDKDMRSIPCRLWNPDKPMDGIESITEEQADRFHLQQTLEGDRVDGYPGCPGIGKVRAARILDAVDDPDSESWYFTAWGAVVDAYEGAGLTEDDALLQARLARILRAGEYNPRTGEVDLWNPTTREATA